MNTDYSERIWRRRWREHGRFVKAAIDSEKSADPDWTLMPEYAETEEWAAQVAEARERVLSDGRIRRWLVAGGCAS